MNSRNDHYKAFRNSAGSNPTSTRDPSPSLLENALNNPIRRRYGFNVLFADSEKKPRIEWKKWETEAQTDRDVEEYYKQMDKYGVTCWGFVAGYNRLVAIDFDWAWVYRLWKARFGIRAETLTVQTPNGGLRPHYICEKPETQDKFKESLHVEIKGPGRFVVYEGQASREGGPTGEYKVVNEKPIREDNNITVDTLAFLEETRSRYHSLFWNCFRPHFSKKVLGEPSHELRLFLSDIMVCEGFSDEEVHNLFRDFADYEYKKTQDQVSYTRQRVKAGLKPPTCETLMGKLGWDASGCVGCERKRATPPGKKEKKPKVKVVERPFGLPDPVSCTPFYEQAVVDGELCFIVVDEDGKVGFLREIEIKGSGGAKTVIRPRLDLPYNHYVVKREWLENPDSMLQAGFWTLGKNLLTTYVDFLEAWQATISMGGVTLSYFKDLFKSVPYLFSLGDTDSGKSRWAITVSKLSYRAYYGESPPTADVYEFLTHCGCTIVEDEAQGLERDREKLKLYKVGYQQGAKVMRILINRNTGERRQVFYNAYGVKFFAGEEEVKNKGFMDRCIVMPFVKGHPPKDEFDPADDLAFEEVRGKLLAMRILVAAGKLSVMPYTCNEPWFEGRFKELYKPLLSVMPDSERQLIIQAAKERYEAKRAETAESIEAKCVLAYLEAVKANNNNPHLSTEVIYEYLKPTIEAIPEQYRPGLRNIGMKLTKLGFKTERLRVNGKRPRIRFADAITLTKLIRKYGLADTLEEKSLTLPNYETLTEKPQTPLIQPEVGPVGQVGPTLPSPSTDTPATPQTMEKVHENDVGPTGPTGPTSGAISVENNEERQVGGEESRYGACWLCRRLLPNDLKNTTVLSGKYVHLECYLKWRQGQRTIESPESKPPPSSSHSAKSTQKEPQP